MQSLGEAPSSSLIVLHWCLDTYPTLQTITSLDVDGYLTNSRALVGVLGHVAPTTYMPLAADPMVSAAALKLCA